MGIFFSSHNLWSALDISEKTTENRVLSKCSRTASLFSVPCNGNRQRFDCGIFSNESQKQAIYHNYFRPLTYRHFFLSTAALIISTGGTDVVRQFCNPIHSSIIPWRDWRWLGKLLMLEKVKKSLSCKRNFVTENRTIPHFVSVYCRILLMYILLACMFPWLDMFPIFFSKWRICLYCKKTLPCRKNFLLLIIILIKVNGYFYSAIREFAIFP